MDRSTSETIHVVFTPSGAGILRQALRQQGIVGRVTELTDNLSYGPIQDTDSQARFHWLKAEIGSYDEWPEQYNEIQTDVARFWRESADGEKRVVWLTRRSLREYAGFLEWVWRYRDETYDVIDLTDVPWPGEAGSAKWLMSLGAVAPEYLDTQQLLSAASPLARAQLQDYLSLWEGLRRENSELRVVGPTGPVSVPITHYDEMILSFARPQWLKVARIAGSASAATWTDDYIQCGFEFFSARIRALVSAGRLEAQGNLRRERHSEVRLPR